ncbi:MAG: dihydropteroate synthase [Gammaproteobacteria bacterium]
MISRKEYPVIMGILNATPDSFSDGGNFQDPEIAIMHALNMVGEGADIIDIGGESTRPGADRVSVAEQKQRVLPIISELSRQLPENVIISIDTTLAEVAEAAVEVGAGMINDVSAGRDDPDMVKVASACACPYIIMHMLGTPKTMQENPAYGDVVKEVRDFLLERAGRVQAGGVRPENIIIDPGIGFGKTRDHNLALLANLQRFVETGYPVLLGASRKRFMGALCAGVGPAQLTGATCATTALGVAAGVRIFRVHDVRENRQAADVAWQILHR